MKIKIEIETKLKKSLIIDSLIKQFEEWKSYGAIESNYFEGKDRERKDETDIFITQRFIADELEELKKELEKEE